MYNSSAVFDWASPPSFLLWTAKVARIHDTWILQFIAFHFH